MKAVREGEAAAGGAAMAAELKRRLFALGFDEVRFASLADVPAGGIEAWIEQGMHGEMAWMERTLPKRLDPQAVLPGARSIVMLGVNYWREGALAGSEREPAWARYSLYQDYHDTMTPALAAAGRVLEELGGVSGADYRYYVDTGPVLERGWAARAGVGFIGKNGMLISRRFGNWLFLGAILTRVVLPPDEAVSQKRSAAGGGVGLLCGKCTRCLDACPTDAFAAPGVVDARRCVSYQTIENKGVIPRELRRGIGRRIYGCDVCLEVCPWNRFAQQGREVLLAVKGEIAALTLRELLELTPESFARIFRGTAIKRVKLAGLLRNACVVAGNSGEATLLPALVKLAREAVPLVRAHAVWATYRLAGDEQAERLLDDARRAESDPLVLAEYAAELGAPV